MASQLLIQGQPQGVLGITSGDLRSILARNQESTADIRPAIYVRPLGRVFHLVKNLCNDQVIRVASKARVTFSPGSFVYVASNSGHPGEIILSEPPPLKRGASIVQPQFSLLTSPSKQYCPLSGRDHKYLGLFAHGTDLLTVVEYIDGTVNEVLIDGINTNTLAGVTDFTDPVVMTNRAIVFRAQGAALAEMYMIVNAATGTLTAIDRSSAHSGSWYHSRPMRPFGSLSTWYWLETKNISATEVEYWLMQGTDLIGNFSQVTDESVPAANNVDPQGIPVNSSIMILGSAVIQGVYDDGDPGQADGYLKLPLSTGLPEKINTTDFWLPTGPSIADVRDGFTIGQGALFTHKDVAGGGNDRASRLTPFAFLIPESWGVSGTAFPNPLGSHFIVHDTAGDQFFRRELAIQKEASSYPAECAIPDWIAIASYSAMTPTWFIPID